MTPAHPSGATMSGAMALAQIRTAAAERGVAPTLFVRPLTKSPHGWLDQLGRARQPSARTLDRITALIEGRPIPGLGEPGSVAAQVALEAETSGARRYQARSTGSTVNTPLALDRAPDVAANADPVDREPCFRCGTRGDIGCAHPRRAAA